MAMFGRRKASTPPEAHDEHLTDGTSSTDDAEVNTDDFDESMRRRRSRLRPRDEVDLSRGPFDIDDEPEGERIDFGALTIAPMPGVELRLDVDETSQLITGMTAMLGEGGSAAVQMQAFAAPKTSGIWYGIRREITESLVAAGGTAEEVPGELGTELHVRMPHQGPDGRTTYSPARFVGVDGPRWFLRAVLSGEAAVSEAMAREAMAFVRCVAVRRGSEARAPRELLELTIPQELANQAGVQQQADPASSDPGVGPLERGPEITETR